MMNVDCTCGELVESNWVSLGSLTNFIQEMGFEHQQDTISDAMDDWNWGKVVGEGELRSEMRLIVSALRCFTLRRPNFEGIWCCMHHAGSKKCHHGQSGGCYGSGSGL
jgi:hypothetical protein